MEFYLENEKSNIYFPKPYLLAEILGNAEMKVPLTVHQNQETEVISHLIFLPV
jgi:hypothetical protein